MLLFNTISKALLRKEYKRRLTAALEPLDNSYRFFFLPQGLGDILFFCMYAHAYRQKNPQEHISLIVTKPHVRDLAEMFLEDIDLLLQIDERYYRMGDTTRFYYLYPHIYNPAFPQDNLAEAVRNALGLPKGAERVIPEVESNPYLMGRLLGKKTRRRIAMIAPDANSCNPMLSDQDWSSVAKNLEKKGYCVVFNNKDKDRFPNFVNVFLSVKEMIQFCNECALFIGYRSGLCDVISAFCRCRQIVIYPNDRKKGEFDCVEGYDQNPNQRYMEYCSLKSIFPEAEVKEFIYDKNNYMQKLEELIYG